MYSISNSTFLKRVNGLSPPFNIIQIMTLLSYIIITSFYFFHLEYLINYENKNRFSKYSKTLRILSFICLFFVPFFYFFSIYINPEFVTEQAYTKKRRRKKRRSKQQHSSLLNFFNCFSFKSFSNRIEPIDDQIQSQTISKPTLIKPNPASSNIPPPVFEEEKEHDEIKKEENKPYINSNMYSTNHNSKNSSQENSTREGSVMSDSSTNSIFYGLFSYIISFRIILFFLCCYINYEDIYEDDSSIISDNYLISLLCGVVKISRKNKYSIKILSERRSSNSNYSNTNNDWVNNRENSTNSQLFYRSDIESQPSTKVQLNQFHCFKCHSFNSDPLSCISFRSPCSSDSSRILHPSTSSVSLSNLKLFSLSLSKSQSFTNVPQSELSNFNNTSIVLSPNPPNYYSTINRRTSLKKRDISSYYYQLDFMRMSEWGENFLPNVLRTSQYCFDCNKKIWELDHHCVFLNNCIGKKNYPFFFCLLVFYSLQLSLHLIYSVLFFIYLENFHINRDYFVFKPIVYQNKNLFLVLNSFQLFISFFLFLAVFFLLCFHLYLNLYLKIGTYDFMMNSRSRHMNMLISSPSNSFSVSSHCVPYYDNSEHSSNQSHSHSQSFNVPSLFNTNNNSTNKSFRHSNNSSRSVHRKIEVKSTSNISN